MRESHNGWQYDPRAREFEHIRSLHEMNRQHRPSSYDVQADEIVSFCLACHVTFAKQSLLFTDFLQAMVNVTYVVINKCPYHMCQIAS